VCGYSDYIDGNYPFTSFEYVRNCFMKKECPQLSLERRPLEIKDDLYVEDFPEESVHILAKDLFNDLQGIGISQH
jgi:hypothetical protein